VSHFVGEFVEINSFAECAHPHDRDIVAFDLSGYIGERREQGRVRAVAVLQVECGSVRSGVAIDGRDDAVRQHLRLVDVRRFARKAAQCSFGTMALPKESPVDEAVDACMDASQGNADAECEHRLQNRPAAIAANTRGRHNQVGSIVRGVTSAMQ